MRPEDAYRQLALGVSPAEVYARAKGDDAVLRAILTFGEGRTPQWVRTSQTPTKSAAEGVSTRISQTLRTFVGSLIDNPHTCT